MQVRRFLHGQVRQLYFASCFGAAATATTIPFPAPGRCYSAVACACRVSASKAEQWKIAHAPRSPGRLPRNLLRRGTAYRRLRSSAAPVPWRRRHPPAADISGTAWDTRRHPTRPATTARPANPRPPPTPPHPARHPQPPPGPPPLTPTRPATATPTPPPAQFIYSMAARAGQLLKGSRQRPVQAPAHIASTAPSSRCL